ncbi:arylsulfatase [Arenibacter palladensis]|uniref:arylsulfatase n=1 Tax=Arenibacter palladensis TaxID=237373 RepID=UPI0026E3857F|nr:arylsulfatase [Arenibacter palladensis]MDO6602843.1 arylsulfatase [Arenibacter palladensis]
MINSIKHFGRIISVAILTFAFFGCENNKKKELATTDHTNVKPNVIIIMADDQGYGDLSLNGNPILKTPYMDKIGKESVRFTDFHVAPMCTPTRGQLMTGVDALRNGATAVCQGHSMMFREIPIMPEYFKQSGYATGLFGKWHLGDSYPHLPQDRGFEETLSFPAWGITSLADHFGNSYFDPYLRHNGIEEKYEGFSTDIFFREAKKWIRKKKNDNQPFFLYLPTNTPHVPEIVAEQYSKPYKNKNHNGIELPSDFYGMIANIDDNLKGMDEFLEKEGLKDNTIFIYLSDNGTQNHNASMVFNKGMRGKKQSVYEGGHRVPLFIRWPGGKYQSKDIDALVQVQDILPTLMELCQLKPIDGAIGLNGTSLSGVLKKSDPEKLKQLNDRKIVIQYSKGETSAKKWDNALVLWDKWRLVGREELYNISEDPSQENNIYKDQKEIGNAMSSHYDKWYEEAKPRFDQPRFISVGDSKSQEIELFANDWVGGYCDNPPGLVRANKTGFWNLIIEEPGEYEFELRRWPDELNMPISAGIDGSSIIAHEKFTGEDVGKRPIHFAQIEIDDFEDIKIVESTDTKMSFRAELKPGKTKLKTLFLNKDMEELCSAIYVNVKKL